MPTFKKPRKLALLCVLLNLPLAACATQTVAVDRGCDWTRDITYARTDTKETVNQVREHNAARAAVCAKKV